ncbi:hypothetical protein D3C71_1499300 [compost metagenome]
MVDGIRVVYGAWLKPQVLPARPSMGALATRVVPCGQLPLASSIGTEVPLMR